MDLLPIRIDYVSPTDLPPTPIRVQGPVSQAFLDRGAATLLEAALQVKAMPYGYNSANVDSLILLREGFGTCITKHGLVARLAQELGVPIFRYEGLYSLTESLVPGTDDLLQEFQVPYVPRIHCFLEYRGEFFDLTEGNCTGKKAMIYDYFGIFPVPADQSQEEADRTYGTLCEELQAAVPAFARLTMDRMFELRDRSMEITKLSCLRAN